MKKSKAKPAPKSRARDQAKPAKPAVSLDAMTVIRAQAKAQQNLVGQIAQTADGFDNFVSRLGLNNDNTLSAGTYQFNLITRNRIMLEAAYRGSWIVGAVVDSVAEDMTRAGIDFQTAKADADIPELKKLMTKLQIWNSVQNLVKWGRLYGGAIAVMQIEGQDLSTPIDLETIGLDQFKGLVVYDRWQLNPDLTRVIDSGPDIGLPKFYQIVTGATQSSPTAEDAVTGGLNVHHSRCIRYTGIDLPFFQAITEMMWGESILERLWDRLIAFDSATMSAANLIERANNRMVGIEGLREILAAGGAAQQGLVNQFEMMRSLQTNEGITLLDKNDEYQTTSYTFSGLSDVLLQFGQQLAGASAIPLVRLFGQSPAGLNATGDADIRMYYDNINAQQEAKLRTPFSTLVKVLWRSAFGKESPKDLNFDFTPLWQMSEKDKAEIGKANAETIVGVYDSGVVPRKSALEELRDSSGNHGLFSNITDEMISDAEAEEDEPPMPGETALPGFNPKAPDPAVDPKTTPTAPMGGEKVNTGDAKPRGWLNRFMGPAGNA